ncbi:MAG: hypothetical protein LBV23_03090 [Deltaproteobacteria bacterium]|jgi:hypothetical protein|nr:hypothetical protein [Deltaproteobacteria bacterium]
MEFDSLLNTIFSYADQYGPDFPSSELKDLVTLFMEYHANFKRNLAGEDDFLTISQIEEMMLNLFKKQKEIDIAVLTTCLRRFKSEWKLIVKKKIEYLDKGLKLKNFRRYKTSFMTLAGRLPFERIALIPSTPGDAKKLAELSQKKLIFPFDKALGLAHLPYNMTVGTMLEVALVGSTSDSFEDAENVLLKRTDIKINDDSIRSVTNLIGSLVRANDVKIAEDIWVKNKPWTFREQKKQINHNLYLEVDGVMFRTREKDEQGSTWKENKLGLAFSTDNMLFWTDKHGKKQHRLLKKEYISIIGTIDEFKKPLYSLAIRNGYGKYKNTILLSDGATWIRNQNKELFRNVQQILNFEYLK